MEEPAPSDEILSQESLEYLRKVAMSKIVKEVLATATDKLFEEIPEKVVAEKSPEQSEHPLEDITPGHIEEEFVTALLRICKK